MSDAYAPGMVGPGVPTTIGAICVALLAGLPASASAQGSCTVPHGSPASPTNGFVLTEAPGTGWVQLTVFHLNTRDQFGPNGRSAPYFADGHLITTSLIATAVVGIVRGVDVWAQLPVHTVRFEEASGARASTGLGDPRFYVRVGPELVGIRPGTLPVALAVRGGVKFPGAEFPVDAQLIPITEGQRDWELLLEFGKTFDPLPLYAMGWVGYRWREENTKIGRDPGDERFAYLAAGTRHGPVTLRVGVQALWGSTPRNLSFAIPTARRRMFEILPTVARRVGPGEVQVGSRIPVTGRNLPGGVAFSFGYFFAWGDRSSGAQQQRPLKRLAP